jgi:hypothetical protein
MAVLLVDGNAESVPSFYLTSAYGYQSKIQRHKGGLHAHNRFDHGPMCEHM